MTRPTPQPRPSRRFRSRQAWRRTCPRPTTRVTPARPRSRRSRADLSSCARPVAQPACRGATQISRIGYDVLMSATPNSADKVRYKIDYSQVAKGGEGTPPHFEIYTESLEVDGEILFDRGNPDGSVLQGALKYLGGDIGILSAVRRAELDGAATGVPAVVVELAKEVSRLNRFRLEPYALRGASPLPDLTAPDAPRIGHAGENAAATLYFLDKTGSPALTHIVDGLKRALPDFDSFEFNTVGAQRIGFSMRFSDVRGSITGVPDRPLQLHGHPRMLRPRGVTVYFRTNRVGTLLPQTTRTRHQKRTRAPAWTSTGDPPTSTATSRTSIWSGFGRYPIRMPKPRFLTG